MKRTVILTALLLTLVNQALFAQQQLKIKLYLSQDYNDTTAFQKTRGNIYTIHVYKAGDSDTVEETTSSQRYNVLFYLDDRMFVTLKNQTLPAANAVNLRGQLPGRHEIRVDIEDGDSNVLTTEKIAVNVSGAS